MTTDELIARAELETHVWRSIGEGAETVASLVPNLIAALRAEKEALDHANACNRGLVRLNEVLQARAERAEARERALLTSHEEERAALVENASLRHRIKEERARAERAEAALELANTNRKALEESANSMLEAATELAQYASYAEIVGGVSVNRAQVRKWCEAVFAIRKTLPEDENFEPSFAGMKGGA